MNYSHFKSRLVLLVLIILFELILYAGIVERQRLVKGIGETMINKEGFDAQIRIKTE